MRAYKPRLAAVADAYALQDLEQKMPNHLCTTKTRLAAFELAVQAFLACACDAHEGGSDKYKNYHQLAVKCLEEAGNIIEAAKNYRIAQIFTKAALYYESYL